MTNLNKLKSILTDVNPSKKQEMTNNNSNQTDNLQTNLQTNLQMNSMAVNPSHQISTEVEFPIDN